MTKEILEEYSSDEEREAIRGWLRRKGYDPAEATPREPAENVRISHAQGLSDGGCSGSHADGTVLKKDS